MVGNCLELGYAQPIKAHKAELVRPLVDQLRVIKERRLSSDGFVPLLVQDMYTDIYIYMVTPPPPMIHTCVSACSPCPINGVIKACGN